LAAGTGDYKDGLVYAQLDSTFRDGSFTDSKLMWSLGNYSRFIRPGATRIGVTAIDKDGNTITEGDTDPWGLMISAYRNTDNSVVAVLINYSNTDKTMNLNLANNRATTWQPYVTSDKAGYNLFREEVLSDATLITIQARSIVTLISVD
ncbi:MAG: xylanase, partial [Salinivirgaceae bacterium]|nr:xylanase [Salinivirgaceae bacterium]